jgi:hypothetical protein
MVEEFKPVSHSDLQGDVYVHPSFGTIEISRWHGSDRPLFGSSIVHRSGISIRINHAELHRSLNRDWIHSRAGIVEVDLSPSQFADAITSLNSGSTPVTLRWINDGKDKIEEPPFQSKISEFNAEFQQDIDNLSKGFDEAIKLANETHAQKRLIKELEMLKQGFKNNIPFITTQFSEQIAKTVAEAKGEVEAFVEAKLKGAGLEKLTGEAPRLMITGKVEGNE